MPAETPVAAPPLENDSMASVVWRRVPSRYGATVDDADALDDTVVLIGSAGEHGYVAYRVSVDKDVVPGR